MSFTIVYKEKKKRFLKDRLTFLLNAKTAVFVFISMLFFTTESNAINLPDPLEEDIFASVVDTIPMVDRKGDFINNGSNNPFDIEPNILSKEIEYDPKTNKYYIIEKIGDEYYRTPTYMTFEEYLDYKAKKSERDYFRNLAGIRSSKKSSSGKIDPMSKIDVSKSLVDRLFGGTEVTIKPQGSVDLEFELFDYTRREDPSLPSQSQNQLFIPGGFNLRPKLNVEGSIGKKLNLDFNYDTQSTFNFDQKVKLEYDTEAFSEDDIVKKIEAGNVSLPLKGNLIQGAQSLFGLKTELQFGHLRITALASQQQSKPKNLRIENGSSVEEFEIRPDEYDENRHFFLSHYNRDTYEGTLGNLPQVNTAYRISQIEVWISDDRRDYQQGSTMIGALADIGEPLVENYTNEPLETGLPLDFTSMDNAYLVGAQNQPLADNRVNPLFNKVVNDDDVNDIDKASSILSSSEYGMRQTTDFEIFRGRLLSSSEYTYNEQLGFISLNIRLRPNQVLGVAYKYFYTANCDSVYTVGQLAGAGLSAGTIGRANEPEPEPEAQEIHFVKLLKSSNQQINNPNWDLMMKNVYNLRTSQLSKEGFTFDIFYEDDFADGSLKRYIPEPGFTNIPLLNLFNLDNLNRFDDPQADGIFDFVPGVTVIERNGSIVFPVLEPFGESLANLLGDQELIDKYAYEMLYDTTLVGAQQNQENNKFVMMGKVEGATSGEISLGPFVPKGSVRVRAGGVELIEGQDYEIDYSLGRLRVINPSYLAQGTPINVTFEDQSLFNLQQKTMVGLRADYDFSDKFTMGATYLRVKERPFTQKVNIGDEPINNRMFGIDLNYTTEVPIVTSIVDKLPFYSTKEPSSFNLSAEGAALVPGQNNAINLSGEDVAVVSIDDFEGAISGFTLGGFNVNSWRLASTPPEFREYDLVDDLRYGANRARTSWYQIDRASRNTQEDRDHPYSRLIEQNDLFPNRQVAVGQNELFTFDVSFFPEERGPYNFDIPAGYPGISEGLVFDEDENDWKLDAPETRWGGMMRYFQNNDFEAANYEFIEFWVLNPFMDRADGSQHELDEEGEIVFQLGNVSEDVLKDNLQFYENGISVDPDNPLPVKQTNWGQVGLTIPLVDGFDRQNIEAQDLGYDGLDNDGERAKYSEYLAELQMAGSPVQSILEDPANDDFAFYNDPTLQAQDLVSRFKRFNNPQGNTPIQNSDDNNQGGFRRGNRLPEREDMNNNRALDSGEAFYEYRVKINNAGGLVDTDVPENNFRQKRTVTKNGVTEEWYRFQIPLNSGIANNIESFRSIQFMRMYFTKFKTAKTFRFADFQLVRSQWRRSKVQQCADFTPDQIDFSIDEVGREENSEKLPFNYRVPQGIKQERIFGNFANLLQDERSMALKYCNLPGSCQLGINKLTRLDLTLYDRLQLFVHAEEAEGEEIPDGDMAVFVRLGKDLVNNYYEYEIPLIQSDASFPNNEENIWPDSNFIDVKMDKFLEAKKQKLTSGTTGEFSIPDPDRPDATITVKGVPSLGYIKILEIGVRNKTIIEEKEQYCGEVWVNELRAVGLENKGGYAAQANAQLRMADFGDLNLTGQYSSIGFGAIDAKLADRNQEEIIQYDAAANLALGKIMPKFLPLNLPLFAQYSKQISNPRFDPYQRDLTVREVQETAPDQADEIRERSQNTTTIKSVNLTNVKIDAKGGKLWSPSNLSGSYAYTETDVTDPIIESDKTTETTIGLEYAFSNKGKYVRPLKFIKSKYLKFLSEFNFNPLPSALGFSTNVNRLSGTRRFRLPESPVFQFDDRRYMWDRNYNLDWNFAKSLRFNFRANVSSIVDELRQVEIRENPEDRPYVNEFSSETNEEGDNFNDLIAADPNYVDTYRRDNLREFGRAKNYSQQASLSYKVPFKNFPGLDWVSASADYKAQYNWTAGPLLLIDTDGNLLGNVIQNAQTRSANATFNFDRLYKKSKYLKKIEAGKSKSRSRSRTQSKKRGAKDDDNETVASKDKKRKKDRMPSAVERLLIRPLMVLRSVKLTYREDFATLIPGFTPEAELLGLASGFSSPGWDFAAGIQPDLNPTDGSASWLERNQQWFNPSNNFNEQINQRENQSISAKIALEPFKDFKIDVDFNKTYRRDHTEIFKSKTDDPANPNFSQQARYDVGGFEYSHMGISTLFDDSEALYNQFKVNRRIVSNRLVNKNGAGNHPEYEDYAEGYGPVSYAVGVPAFLAAYTGDATILDETEQLAIESNVRARSFIPKPNWQLNYNGLSKLAFFKNFLSDFQLKHGYKSTIAISSFNTAPDYNFNSRFSKLTDNDNYFTRLEIPALTITEQFSPVIGVSLKTKSDMNINFEYKKARDLDLRLVANELTEVLSEEFVFGFGYTIKNFKGFRKKKKRRRSRRDEEEKDKNNTRRKTTTNNKGKSITINADFSIRDNISFVTLLQTDARQVNRGQRVISLEPNVEYQMYKNLALRFFFRYNKNTPYNTLSFPTTNMSSGITVRFTFN